MDDQTRKAALELAKRLSPEALRAFMEYMRALAAATPAEFEQMKKDGFPQRESRKGGPENGNA